MSTAPVGPGYPAPPSTPPSGGGRLWPILTGLFAVIALALAGVLLWPSGEAEAEEPVLGSAQSTAELACQILEEVPMTPVELDSQEYYEIQGQVLVVSSLGWLASAQDPAFSTFRSATQEPVSATNALHPVDSPEFTEAMDAAQAECADRVNGFGED